MASDQQDDEYKRFLKAQQSEPQSGSVLDRPRPFTKPPKGSQKGLLIVVAVFVLVMVGLRVALWLSR
jgi:hypothetical protein